MPLTREDLRNQLKRREISPVYLLFGPETHLRDIAARTIADLSFDLARPALREIFAGEMDHGSDPVELRGVDRAGVDVPRDLVGRARCMAHERPHLDSARCEFSHER